MPNLNKRMAKMGTIVAVILLFSIVMFMSSLFWLTINGPWNGELGQTQLFTPAKSPPLSIDSTISNITETDPSLIVAITILKKEGCYLAPYDKYVNVNDAECLKFTEFKEKALKKGVILIIPDDTGEVNLLILDKNAKYIWKP